MGAGYDEYSRCTVTVRSAIESNEFFSSLVSVRTDKLSLKQSLRSWRLRRSFDDFDCFFEILVTRFPKTEPGNVRESNRPGRLKRIRATFLHRSPNQPNSQIS